MKVIHISLGGPNHTIKVNGKSHFFEWHPYCGPVKVHKRTLEPVSSQPNDFLEAASLWSSQGKKVDENGLCIWEHPERQEEILRHLGGRHYQVIGYTTIPARKGG